MSNFEKEIQKSVERGVEKGIQRGIVRAVEELICKGVIEQITQRAVNVIALDAISAIQLGAGMEKILKSVLKNETEQIENTILSILKKKHGDFDETKIINLVKNILTSNNLNIIVDQALESDSVESFCSSIQNQNISKEI